MSIVEFELPEELKAETYEKILAKMLSLVPEEYDATEGSFVYDMIAPTALESAELIQLWLALGLKTNFFMFAKGYWLDLHAKNCGLQRKSATCSYGNIQVTTKKKVTFQKGFIFSIPSEDGSPAIDFETTQDYTLNSAGTYTLRAKSVLSGAAQNVAKDTISIMKNPVKGVAAITNEAFAGGVEAESDDSLRQRIDDFYAGRASSFVGNRKDYEFWAREVAGVGYARCIPCYDGANSVKIAIAADTGEPAAEETLEKVREYIFGKGETESERHNDLNRLAPIGVTKYEVVAPSPVSINISLNAVIEVGYTENAVKGNIKSAITNYFKTLADTDNTYGTVKYSKVWAILTEVAGLADFSNLKINSNTNNISFEVDKFPVVGTITLN